MKCPVCQGKGRKKIRLKARFAGGWHKKRTRWSECPWCDGRGKVSQADYDGLMSVLNAQQRKKDHAEKP